MSKIGKKAIEIPAGVELEIKGSTVNVKGPKGQLSHTFVNGVSIVVEGTQAITAVENVDQRKFWGLSRTLLSNMIEGVTHGYEKKLLIMGVGYAVKMEGKKFIFSLGFSHKVDFTIPATIEAKVEQDPKGNYIITLNGIDKQYLGEYAAKVKALKKPEPYKGKGIRYFGEEIKLKPGKAAAK
ncbi:MAG: 50S ribosomal protein L6 [Candidatus Absconditabacterales bacterium]